jgi:transcriptional regulator with XRE-family HTH domain
MDFTIMSDAAVLGAIGDRLKQERLNQNVTQAALAELSGVSTIVVQRAEAGKGCSLRNFVRLLRTLGKLDHLNALLPEPGISPIELARLSGRRRKEASGKRGRPAVGLRES